MKRNILRPAAFLLIGLIFVYLYWADQQMTALELVHSTQIPEESIRLRILAHSDRPRDQWLKEEVRNAVVAQIEERVKGVDRLDEARQVITAVLPHVEQVVGETIQAHGFNYEYSVSYGQIPFPTKLYGYRFYPAGEYEGLLITIGAGQGENWWCVLFPPLCFVDFGTGEAVEADAEPDEAHQADGEGEGPEDDGAQGNGTALSGSLPAEDAVQDAGADRDRAYEVTVQLVEPEQIEVRFFFLDLLQKVKNLFV